MSDERLRAAELDLLRHLRKSVDRVAEVSTMYFLPSRGAGATHLGAKVEIPIDAWDIQDYPLRAEAEHIAYWDPARVLAEVKSKRRVLSEYRDAEARRLHYERDGEEPFATESRAYAEALEMVLRVLAEPYASHPDYRQEWAL